MDLAVKIREMQRLEREIRAELVEQILKNASPHFYEGCFVKSGELDGPSEYIQLVALDQAVELDEEDEAVAITEEGIFSDCFCGAANRIPFGELSIAALEKLVEISEGLDDSSKPPKTTG